MPNETREMALFSMVVNLAEDEDRSLAEFIARRRQPGEEWRTWDQIRYELAQVSGQIVSDGSIRKWAERYGIPQYTQADGQGDVNAKAYARALAKAGISIN